VATLRPTDLQRLTDELADDENTIWRLIDVDPALPEMPVIPAEIVEAALEILDDAYFIESLSVTSWGEFAISLIGVAVAVAGIGIG
jgi:hypothetical protein